MFSGIVEEMGKVIDYRQTHQGLGLVVEIATAYEGIKIGDSVSVNGVCLTVCKRSNNQFFFDVMPETIRCTTLAQLSIGSLVNIERSIKADTPIGGHFVQGHVDGTSYIVLIEKDGCALKIWFTKLTAYSDCFIPKGYIAVDGMSLTIVDVTPELFSICFIPHTQEITVVQSYKVETKVNIEIDHIAKTIAIMLNQKGLSYGNYR